MFPFCYRGVIHFQPRRIRKTCLCKMTLHQVLQKVRSVLSETMRCFIQFRDETPALNLTERKHEVKHVLLVLHVVSSKFTTPEKAKDVMQTSNRINLQSVLGSERSKPSENKSSWIDSCLCFTASNVEFYVLVWFFGILKMHVEERFSDVAFCSCLYTQFR